MLTVTDNPPDLVVILLLATVLTQPVKRALGKRSQRSPGQSPGTPHLPDESHAESYSLRFSRKNPGKAHRAPHRRSGGRTCH